MSITTLISRRTAILSAFLTFAVTPAFAQSTAPTQLRIGYQKSSTLTAVLKENGELEKALAARGVKVTWHEFTSGLPQVEALNTGNIDFSADVADTVPIFAQAAGARLAYVAQESASPTAQAILVPAESSIKSLEELKGKRIAVTKAAGSHYLLIAALNKVGLTFKDITPAYLTPADGRAALVSKNVDAWVSWDPFVTSSRRKSEAKLLADGTGLANYKRYYLASEDYAAKHGDVLNIVYAKLAETGNWINAKPKEAADVIAGIWGIDAPTVLEANSHRSYKVGIVTIEGLAEQQKIADAFLADGVLPKKVDTSDVKIWQPTSSRSQK